MRQVLAADDANIDPFFQSERAQRRVRSGNDMPSPDRNGRVRHLTIAVHHVVGDVHEAVDQRGVRDVQPRGVLQCDRVPPYRHKSVVARIERR